MNFLPEWLPNYHPLIVHFPIVLIIAAAVLNLVQVLRSSAKIGNLVSLFYLSAAASAIAALLTGEQGSEILNIPDAVFPVVNNHSDWAHWTVYAIVIAAGISVLGRFISPKFSIILNYGSLAAGFLSVVLVAKTADVGGSLVFEHNLGTKNLQSPAQNDPVEPVIQSDANWLEITAGVFPALFSLDSMEYTSLSISAQLNLDRFNGTVDLIHHFQDSSNYDFMRIGKNVTSLGRNENGIEKLLGTKKVGFSGWTKWKCFADGRHFRGYLDGTMVTHGHIDPLPAGKTYISYNGLGKFEIVNYRVESLK